VAGAYIYEDCKREPLETVIFSLRASQQISKFGTNSTSRTLKYPAKANAL